MKCVVNRICYDRLQYLNMFETQTRNRETCTMLQVRRQKMHRKHKKQMKYVLFKEKRQHNLACLYVDQLKTNTNNIYALAKENYQKIPLVDVHAQIIMNNMQKVPQEWLGNDGGILGYRLILVIALMKLRPQKMHELLVENWSKLLNQLSQYSIPQSLMIVNNVLKHKRKQALSLAVQLLQAVNRHKNVKFGKQMLKCYQYIAQQCQQQVEKRIGVLKIKELSQQCYHAYYQSSLKLNMVKILTKLIKKHRSIVIPLINISKLIRIMPFVLEQQSSHSFKISYMLMMHQIASFLQKQQEKQSHHIHLCQTLQHLGVFINQSLKDQKINKIAIQIYLSLLLNNLNNIPKLFHNNKHPKLFHNNKQTHLKTLKTITSNSFNHKPTLTTIILILQTLNTSQYTSEQ